MKTDLNKTETAKEDATFTTSHANTIPLLFIHDFFLFLFLLLLSRQKDQQRELISARKALHEYSNTDPDRLR